MEVRKVFAFGNPRSGAPFQPHPFGDIAADNTDRKIAEDLQSEKLVAPAFVLLHISEQCARRSREKAGDNGPDTHTAA